MPVLPWARGLDRLVMRWRPDGELPWGVFRHREVILVAITMTPPTPVSTRQASRAS
jgi:hypothetical protein